MPQLAMFNAKLHDPVEFVASYRANPLDPDADGELTIRAQNVAGDWVDYVYAKVPPNVTHELVVEALHNGWEAWLFGEPGSMKRAVGQVIARWKLYSKSIGR